MSHQKLWLEEKPNALNCLITFSLTLVQLCTRMAIYPPLKPLTESKVIGLVVLFFGFDARIFYDEMNSIPN